MQLISFDKGPNVFILKKVHKNVINIEKKYHLKKPFFIFNQTQRALHIYTSFISVSIIQSYSITLLWVVQAPKNFIEHVCILQHY